VRESLRSSLQSRADRSNGMGKPPSHFPEAINTIHERSIRRGLDHA
jgi:hypothetical protein